MRHEGFDVTFIGVDGFVGGLVRCPANTNGCMTRKWCEPMSMRLENHATIAEITIAAIVNK